MSKILIGSKAAAFHFNDFYRLPHDTDYIVTEPEEKMSNSRGIEYFYHPMLSNYFKSDGLPMTVATPDELYTIKVSHSFWALRNKSWSKHMKDMCWLKNHGAELIPELYDIAYATWEELHGKKKAKLNVSADEFFKVSVPRIYDHDSIHASVAYGERPLFEKILRDGAQVAVSREKFEALSHEDKARLLREEVYATALERVLIPSNYEQSPKKAYQWALFKTITSFSKGWFPLWVVQNYEELREPDIDYVQRHKDNANRLILLEA